MEAFLRLPLRLKIASVSILVLALLLVPLAFLNISLHRLILTVQEQDQSQRIGHLSEELLTALVDMETGTRGYVITENPAFLEPYHQGLSVHQEILSKLEQLLEDNRLQLDRVARLRALIKGWHDQVLEPEIRHVAEGNAAAAKAIVASGTGKAGLDSIRAQVREIDTAQAAQTAYLAQRTTTAARMANWGTWSGAGLAALIALLLAFRLARSLTRPIHDLEEAAAIVAGGGAGHFVRVRTPDEVGRLAHSFNLMSRQLLADQEENAAQQAELQAQQEELAAQNEELQVQQENLCNVLSELEAERQRLEHLNQFSQEIMRSTGLGSLADNLLTHMLSAGEAQVGALILFEGQDYIHVAAQSGLTGAAAEISTPRGFVRQAAESGRPIVAQYPHSELLRPVYHTELPVEHEVHIPIRFGEETLAVVTLGRTGPNPFTPLQINWLQVLGTQAAAVLSNRLSYEKLRSAYSDLQESAAQIEELSAEVQVERDRMNAVLRTTSEGFWLVSESGETLLVNHRFWELTGMEPRPTIDTAEFCQAMEHRMANSAGVRAFSEIMASGGEVITDLVEFREPRPAVLARFSAPVYRKDGGRLGQLFVLRDVTHETEVDRMKTEFISTVSHELRTPLTSIRGFVDLILDGDAGPILPEQREFLELVSRSTVRLANLINDLLDVEKIESGRIEMRRESFSVEPLLEQVMRTFEVLAEEKGLSLDLQVDGPLPLIHGDADRITQVLTNLVSNAIKYTKAGGVEIATRADGPAVHISVSDSGIGLSAESRAKLFTKFYRVDNEHTRDVGGAGLGLAITKAIVERHGGQILVESEPGKGSTFTVTLPAVDPRGQTPPAHAESGILPERLILIIEDDPDVARLIAQHVSRLGLRTVVAPTGPEGLRLASELMPDLITLDVMMPGMDGWEVISHLKRNPETAGIPVVFLSILEETHRGLRMGANAFLTKPIDARALTSTLSRLLSQSRTTAVLAVRDEVARDLSSILEERGCRVCLATPADNLLALATAESAGLLVLDRNWAPQPQDVPGLLFAIRRTPGLENLPVIVLEPTGPHMVPFPRVLGGRPDTHEVPAHAIAEEIYRYLAHVPGDVDSE